MMVGRGRADRSRMPDRVLQNHYCVAALQPRPLYNFTMRLPVNEQSDDQVAANPSAANPRRRRTRRCRAGLVVLGLVGAGALAVAWRGGSPAPTVAALAVTTRPSAAQQATAVGPSATALAFVNCMRTHGVPDMPDPVISRGGTHINVHISLNPGSDPNSPQFTAAIKACKHLLPNKGVSKALTVTPGDQADYLKAVACMRTHGFPDFPDPVFQNNNVSFFSRSPIDTNSLQYKRALAICDKLIPAGMPYSSTGSL